MAGFCFCLRWCELTSSAENEGVQVAGLLRALFPFLDLRSIFRANPKIGARVERGQS